jgi:hypothetical protein
MSPESRTRANAKAAQLRAEYPLHELRRARGLSHKSASLKKQRRQRKTGAGTAANPPPRPKTAMPPSIHNFCGKLLGKSWQPPTACGLLGLANN